LTINFVPSIVTRAETVLSGSLVPVLSVLSVLSVLPETSEVLSASVDKLSEDLSPEQPKRVYIIVSVRMIDKIFFIEIPTLVYFEPAPLKKSRCNCRQKFFIIIT